MKERGPSWLAWEKAVEEGRIAMVARRDDPRTLIVEAMVEGKELGIFLVLTARGFLQETGAEAYCRFRR